jgi:hypothetical protein
MRLLWLVSVLFALAGTAGGASRPTQLFVWPLATTPGSAAETDVEVANPPPALTIELPDGYGVAASPAGTVVGAVTIRFARGRQTSATLLAAGSGWVGGGLTIAVDSGRLRCDLPPATVDLELDLRHALTNPGAPGIYVWRAGDASSAVALPQSLTLRARHSAGQLDVGGRLIAAGRPRAGVNVHVDVSPNPDFATHTEWVAKTRTDGSFALRLPRRATTEYVVASVSFYAAGTETIAPPPAAYAVTTGA